MSGRRESNSVYLLPKQAYYRYTTPRVEEEYHKSACEYSLRNDGAQASFAYAPSKGSVPHVFLNMCGTLARTRERIRASNGYDPNVGSSHPIRIIRFVADI